MDIIRIVNSTLDPYAPYGNLIEDYSSMIWTERYLNHGEFELKTPQVQKIRDLLPLGTLLSHLDTKEIMMVESHDIGRDSDGYAELSCRGRSLTSVLGNRVIEGPADGKKKAMLLPYTNLDAALAYIWNSVQNTGNLDIVQPAGTTATSGSVRAVPNSVVTDSAVLGTDVAGTRWMQSGTAWPQIKEFLIAGGYGFRIIKPDSGASKSVTVATADDASKGTITKTPASSFSTMRWDVYNGIDRTSGQSVVPAIIFTVTAGHIQNPSYIFAIKDANNWAIVDSSLHTNQIEYPIGGFNIPPYLNTGLYARYLYVNAGSPASGEDPIQFVANLGTFGRNALRARPYLVLFDGDVMPNIAYVYNRDYFLGDKVTLAAEYGVSQTMRIDEYIRVDDKDGDRGYPSLLSLL
jgi:Siphovirus ReqiPepy6 Gp37-like protein